VFLAFRCSRLFFLSQLLGYMSTLFLEFTAPPELQWFWVSWHTTAPSTCVPSKAQAFPSQIWLCVQIWSCNVFSESGSLTFRDLGRITYLESKAFSSSHEAHLYRTKDQTGNIRKRMGKNLYQESSNFIIPIRGTKKIEHKMVLYYTKEYLLCFKFQVFCIAPSVTAEPSCSCKPCSPGTFSVFKSLINLCH
jgi:hypothetical protein